MKRWIRISLAYASGLAVGFAMFNNALILALFGACGLFIAAIAPEEIT